MPSLPLLRIGTRGSPMALYQANHVRNLLATRHPELAPTGAIDIQVIKTTGDSVLDRPLAAIGGKGLFTKEIEEALIAGTIDMAVHSMKDVPTVLPDGLEISCLLKRDDPRDAFLSHKAKTLADLPAGSVVGTASLRRQAQVLRARPDLRVESLRGNANTRMRKLAEGVCDATMLALSGLERIGETAAISSILSVDEMLPAVAQGALGIEIRSADDRARAWLAPFDHAETRLTVTAERAVLAALDGNCRTPIAALARVVGGSVSLRALILTPDGRQVHERSVDGNANDSVRLGDDCGAQLRAAGGPDFFFA